MEQVKLYLNKHGFERINLKAVLFDMDGVLFNSMPNHAKAWVKCAEKVGLEMTAEDVYMHEGRTGVGTINMLTQRTWKRDSTPEEQESIYRIKADIFNTLPEAQPIPYAREMLYLVKNLGLTPILVTGSGQSSLLDKLNTVFPDIFTSDHMVTAFDVKYGKPNPEPFLIGLQKAGIEPYEAVVVENAPLGVQASSTAKIFSIAINTGILKDKILYDYGADLVLSSMHDLYTYFPSFLENIRH